jgi:hypothetical protein
MNNMSDKYDYGYNKREATSGCGSYSGKPAVIEVLESRDGFELRKYPNSSTGRASFKILWDGQCISLLDDEKEARNMFLDFAPMPPKKRGRKAKAAA